MFHRFATAFAHHACARGLQRTSPEVLMNFVFLVFIMLVAVWLRWTHLFDEFSIDENWHLYAAMADSWSEFFAAIRIHAHPPLAFLPAWLSLKIFGFSPFQARLVPFLLGVVIIPMSGYGLHRLCRDRWSALIAMALLAVAPNFIEISTSVRGYSLAIFLLVLWMITICNLQDDPTRSSIHVRSLFLMFASVLSNYGALFCIIPTYVVCLFWRRRLVLQSQQNVIMWWFVIYSLFILLAIASAIMHSSAVQLSLLYLKPMIFQGVFSLREMGEYFIQSHLVMYSFGTSGAAEFFLFLGFLGAAYMAYWREVSRRVVITLLVSFCISDISMWFLSVIHRYPYGPIRHSVFLMLLAFAVCAIGLSAAADRMLYPRQVKAIVLAAMLGCGAMLWQWPCPKESSEASTMEHLLSQLKESHSGIVIEPSLAAGMISHIHDHRPVALYTKSHLDNVYNGISFYRDSKADPIVSVRQCLENHDSCWLVRSQDFFPTLESQFENEVRLNTTKHGKFQWLAFSAHEFTKL